MHKHKARRISNALKIASTIACIQSDQRWLNAIIHVAILDQREWLAYTRLVGLKAVRNYFWPMSKMTSIQSHLSQLGYLGRNFEKKEDLIKAQILQKLV